MIRDARVFDPEFVPRDVVHRDGKMDALSDSLSPVLDGNTADTVFLYGPSGAGKTCLARYSVERLHEAVVDLNSVYVNCWQHYTRFRVLHQLLEEIGEAYDIRRQSTARDVLIDRLQEYRGPPYLVVLDEADQLEEPEVLYDLYRAPRISMVLIANREEALFATLDNRISSRLQGNRRIHFGKYGVEELTEILATRVERGLDPGCIDRETLRTIADYAAGDARVGITVLRSAAQEADRQELDGIPTELVRRVYTQAQAEVHQTALDRLKPHQLELYEIIKSAGEIKPGELYERYRERVEDPRKNRTVRKYLDKMATYGLITKEGENRGRTYRHA
jgi:orc1/cdc6 family replication initiation protein